MASRLALLAATLATLAACDSQPVEPPGDDAPLTGRVAFSVYEGTRPVLYTQALDGTDRRRLSLDGVAAGYPREQIFDHATGRYVDAVAVPRDDRALALHGPLRWSPDGQRLTLGVASAFDQAEAVVLGLDGRGVGASPTVATVVAPTFSPDGRRIAYGLWTNQDARFFLLTTDLGTYATTETQTVREVTNSSQFWWAPDGRSVVFSREEFTPAPEYRQQFVLRRLDPATGEVSAVAGPVAGSPVDYAPASGALLVSQNVPAGGASRPSVLVRADGSQTRAPEGRRWTGFAAGRRGYAVTAPYEAGGGGGVEVVAVDGDLRLVLPNLPPAATVAVYLDPAP